MTSGESTLVTAIVPFRTDAGRRQQIWDWIKARYNALGVPVQICDATPGEPFSRGASRNLAAKESMSEYVLIADADTIPLEDAIQQGVDALNAGAPWVICYGEGRYYNLSEARSNQILTSEPSSVIVEPSNPADWEFRVTSWAGMLLMRKWDFLCMNGYDERFKGWGWEDNEFQVRADNEVGQHVRVNSFCCHLWHPYSKEETWEQPFAAFNQRLLKQSKRSMG